MYFANRLSATFCATSNLIISLPSPGSSERCYRSLARRRIAMGWRAVLVVPEGERPHPRRADRRSMGLIDATDNFAVRQHVEIIVVPLAGWPTKRRPLQEQVVFVHSRAA